MVVPPAPDHPGLSDPSHDRSTAAGLRLAVAGVLALVSVVCVGLLVWLLAQQLLGDGSSSDEEAREDAMSVTDQFVKRLGSYGPDMVEDSGQMPQYREQVTEVITDKFAADFEEQVETVEQLVAQAGVERSASVFATGVSSIDDDSARVLVAGSFNDTYTQGTQGAQGTEGSEGEQRTVEQEPLPFRFTVDLVEVEGEWLVDDFTPVSTEGSGEPADPAVPQPTQPSPSEGGAS